MRSKVESLIRKISKILKYFNVYPHVNKLVVKYSPFLPWNIKDYLKMISFYAQFLHKGDLVFDIGANMGNFTMNFLRMNTQVVSVEPQLACLKELYKRFGKNKRVTIVGKALGRDECSGRISISAKETGIATLSERWKKEGRFSKNYEWTINQKVKITTLDHLIKSYSLPKFCKIDVEGFELEVLKGLSYKIPIICFEFTKEFVDDALTCMKHLESLGNVNFNFVKNVRFKLDQPTWSSPNKIYETLISDPDDYLWGDIYAIFR